MLSLSQPRGGGNSPDARSRDSYVDRLSKPRKARTAKALLGLLCLLLKLSTLRRQQRVEKRSSGRKGSGGASCILCPTPKLLLLRKLREMVLVVASVQGSDFRGDWEHQWVVPSLPSVEKRKRDGRVAAWRIVACYSEFWI